jgi:hypothetical protein
MKLPHLLFAILLAMCALIATVFVIGESPVVEVISPETGETSQTPLGHGFTHPEFATMQRGGSGAARHERILWFGCAFGLLQILFFVCLLAYGGQRQGRLGPLKVPLMIGGIAYAATFTSLVYTYQGYMLEQTHAMFLSLPVPTAWMVYGLWLVPLVFMFLYMFIFDSWIFRQADIARFEEILAEKQTASGDQE